MFFLSLALFYVVVYQPIIAKIIWLILEHIDYLLLVYKSVSYISIFHIEGR